LALDEFIEAADIAADIANLTAAAGIAADIVNLTAAEQAKKNGVAAADERTDSAADFFMSKAIEQAKKAEKSGDVPVGCVIVCDNIVVAAGRNCKERKQNAINHAEIMAIRRACRKFHSWRLTGCEMYVTLEPCLMCMGAILNARIKKVIIGAAANVSSLELFEKNGLNWKTEVEIKNDPICRNILIDFFEKKR
jgi:tRNA(adenine34) deaminase